MPTGYTHKVQNGQVTDLKTYALDCAKAFGACITLRDEPSDTPIPDEFKPSTEYYDRGIAEAKHSLKMLMDMSESECKQAAEKEFEAATIAEAESKGEESLQKLRYENMVHQVKNWAVPSQLDELKKFMLSQLQESLKFDCGFSYVPPAPILKTGAEWRDGMIEKAKKDIEYHTKKRNKEIARVAERNEWIKLLRESLK